MTIDYHILIGDSLTPKQKEQIQDIIDTTFQEINAIYNKWNPHSELGRLNAYPAHTPFFLSPQLDHFLQRLHLFVLLSEGRFDPTIEPLQQLWKERLGQGRRPQLEEIESLRPCLGWNTIHLTNGVLYKQDGRTQLDLGGVAKGLCVDLLVERLQQAHFQHVFVEWGGEIRTLGQHPSQRPWRVYIRRLEDPHPSRAFVHLNLTNQALATSGDYFQYWNIQDADGHVKTYCHIFNPLTQTPLEVKPGSVASASLLARDCVTADALAKVLMLFDTAEEAQEWLKGLQLQFPELACWMIVR